MLRKSLRVTAAGLLAALMLGNASIPTVAAREVELRDGLLYVTPGDYDRLGLLERIADAAGIEVVVITTPPTGERVRLLASGWKPEALIRSLLKGGSYALLYRGKSGTFALSADREFSVAPPRSAPAAVDAPAAVGAAQATIADEASWEGLPEPERELLERIATLKKRIASGEADRAHEIWSSVRDPRFVVHDEELLEQFEKELAQLRGGH